MTDPAIKALQAENQRLRTKLDEALEQDKERATFLATMSHELREPMNGVLGMSRLLQDTDLGDEQRAYVDAVVDSAKSLITIINDILDLSRIDAGKLELVDVDFSIPVFFERLGLMLQTRALNKDLDLRLNIAPDLPKVMRGDPGRFRQILINLAGNAIKFTNAGHVTLSVQNGDHDHQLMLSIEDTGIGIPAHLQDHLFTAFAQADSTVTRLYGGSGLGLMIAQKLVQSMGGSIVISSEEGKGTRSEFTLQLSEPSAKSDQTAARATLAGTALLVVDPQERSRELTCELARMWQMQTRGVGSARAARAALQEATDRSQPFDIVLIDRSLPDETGDDFGERLRNDPATKGLKLVLMVASGMRGDAARAKAGGFDAYLPKPLTASTLLDSLQQIRAGNIDELITIHSMSETKRGPLRLLIVDDNEVNCKLASIMLKRAGHEIEIAYDGAQALARIEAESFDAVLMDIQMPVMNGIEATKRIRALSDATRNAIPIIAISANAMAGDDKPCLAAGVNSYVTKPIDRATLLAEIDRHVA